MGRSLSEVPAIWWLLLVALFSLAEATADESLEQGGPLSGEDGQMAKRAGSRACQRCLHNSDDWGSCIACFSRPGPTPYYGEKRAAADPYDWEDDKRANVDPYDWDVKRAYNPYDWRASDPSDFKKRAYDPNDLDKRAYDPYDWRSFDMSDFQKRAYNPYEMEIQKRGLSSCRCCMKIGLSSCCNKCSYAPYYTKRAYRTTYRPQYDEYCSCCRKDRFNFACCINCSGYKK